MAQQQADRNPEVGLLGDRLDRVEWRDQEDAGERPFLDRYAAIAEPSEMPIAYTRAGPTRATIVS